MKCPTFCLPASIRLLALAALLGLAEVAGTPLHAQTAYTYWTGAGTDAKLGNGGNWQGGHAPLDDGSANVVFSSQYLSANAAALTPNLERNWHFDTLTFAGGSSFTLGGSGTGLNIGSGITQNSTAAQTIAVPTFLTDDQTWSFASGAGALNFTTTSASGQIINQGRSLTLNAAGTNTLNGTISGTGALIKSGSGTMVLTGNNTYSGVTTISAGTLQVGSGGASGSLGAGAITNNGTLTINRSDNVTFANAVSGTGGLSQLGTGTLTLTGNNTHTGGMTFSAGVLNVGSAGALGSTGSLTFAGGTLQYSANNQTDYSARFSTTTKQVFKIDTNGQNVTFATALNSNGGSLIKSGLGTLTLTGSVSSAGATTVGAGTLAIGGSMLTNGNTLIVGSGSGAAILNLTGSLSTTEADIGYYQSGTVNQSGGSFTTNGYGLILSQYGGSGTFNLSGGSLSTGRVSVGLVGAGTFNQSGGSFTTNGGILSVGQQNGGTYTLSNGTLTTGRTFVSNDANVSTFTQTGGTHTTDTLSISGDSTASQGTYTLAGGRLNVGSIVNHSPDTNLVGTSIFHFDGGILQATGNSTTFMQGLTTADVQAGGAAVNPNGYNVTIAQNLVHDTTSGAPAIDGGLAKVGNGTLTLAGANTYTGATVIYDGTLALTGSIHGGGMLVMYSNLSDGHLVLSSPNSVLSTGTAEIGVYGTGTVNQSDGSFTTNGNSLLLGLDAIPVGPHSRFTADYYTLSGGTLTTGFTQVGNDVVIGIFTQSGGTHTTGTLGLSGSYTGSYGAYTLAGGTLNVGSIINHNATNLVTGTSIFHFAGGTLQASGNNAAFMQGLSTADVQAGGAKIDTNGYNITVAQNLVHDTTNGASSTDGGLTKLGTGTLTLSGTNTYTGGTLLNTGTLAAASNAALGTGNVEIATGATLTLNAGVVLAGMQGSTLTLDSANNSTVNLLGAGVQDTVALLVIAGITQLPGTYGALGSGATFVLPDFTGTGELLVTAVPEPSIWALLGLGAVSVGIVTLRRHAKLA